ncbi:hypothetical protein Vadar_029411 [Vaccinium darrowii]|uniref:Uncharacterized protein n=1 Tax=Vaccinium darrowii TaxID=229202 RepID=A0ACB7YRM6_9ERIC|nr:hypothetical protein Vadar_029411 [Vaccinium darrowii]
MASSLALKRLVSSNLLRATRQAIPSTHSRLFNTNAVATHCVSHYADDGVPALRSRKVNPESLSGLRHSSYGKMKIEMMEDSYWDAEEMEYSSWDAEETEDHLYLRMDMPGLEREDVKVIVEQNTLIVKDKTIVEQNTVIVMGESKEKSGKKNSGRRYTNKIDLPSKLYKANQIKAEMKSGVLKVVVPKVKEEERSDLFFVKVECVFDPISPFAATSHGMGVELHPGSGVKDNLWDAEETEDSLYLRMDMPELNKEYVKVLVEQNNMIVKGETIVEHITVIVKSETTEKSGAKDSGRRYTNRIDLPSKLYPRLIKSRPR